MIRRDTLAASIDAHGTIKRVLTLIGPLTKITTTNGLTIQFEELFISKIYESLHAHIPCLHTAFVIDEHTESSVHVNPALAMHIDLSGVGE